MRNTLQSTKPLGVLTTAVAVVLFASRPAAANEVNFQQTITSDAVPPSVTQQCGSIQEGTEVVLTVQVENPGEQPFRMGTVQSLCACMTAEPSATTVAPGGQETITLRLETAGYSGETRESALVQWVDSPVAVTRINLELTVVPVLEVSPRRLVRFRTVQGTQAVQEVSIQKPDGGAFELVAIEPSGDHIDVASQQNGNGYTLRITLLPTAPVGMLREKVIVRTNLESLPELELKITGVVRNSS